MQLINHKDEIKEDSVTGICELKMCAILRQTLLNNKHYGTLLNALHPISTIRKDSIFI